MTINDEHDALDPECPTYKRAIKEEKRWMGSQKEIATTEGRGTNTNAQSLLAHEEMMQHQILVKINPTIIIRISRLIPEKTVR